LVLGYLWWQREVVDLRIRRGRLRARFVELAQRGGFLAAAPRSDVALGAPRAYAAELVEEVAAQLLNHVTLELADLRVTKSGLVQKSVLRKTVTLGRWRVDARIHHLRGVLTAGRPRLRFLDEDEISLVVPVTARAGRIESSLRFAWDAHGLAAAVCRDFSVSERAQASIVPETYELAGRLTLVADGTRVGVSSRLDRRRLRVRLQPTDGTWARAREALERQDRLLKCGVALDPDEVLKQLRGLVTTGFDVWLPAELFPRLRIPASFRSQVEQENAPLALGVRVDALRVTPDALWYGASVSVETRPRRRAQAESP
jgi:hypothetical protein